MSLSIRTEASAAGDGNSFTTASGDTALVAICTWTSGSPTGCTWNGVSMSLVNSAVQGKGVGIWYLNDPAIGNYVLELVSVAAQAQWVYYIVGSTGETLSVRDDQQATHSGNDLVTVPTITSDDADLVIYGGVRTSNGNWTGVDSFGAARSGGRVAEEAGNGAGVSAIYGVEFDDQPTAVMGVSFQVESRIMGGGAAIFI